MAFGCNNRRMNPKPSGMYIVCDLLTLLLALLLWKPCNSLTHGWHRNKQLAWSTRYRSGHQRLDYADARRTSSVSLVSLNMNEKKNTAKTIETNSDNEADSEFASWIEGLTAWPRLPNEQVASQKESTTKTNKPGLGGAEETTTASPSSARYRGLNPLSNFLRFEALLDTVEGIVNETDITSFPKFFESPTFQAAVESAEQDPLTSLNASQTLTDVARVEDFLAWEKLLESIPKNLVGGTQTTTAAETDAATNSKKFKGNPLQPAPVSNGYDISRATEYVLKDATARLEYLVAEASTMPGNVQDLILRATKAFNKNQVDDLVKVVGKVASDQGVDVREATEGAREATRSAARMVATANTLFAAGYARNMATPINKAAINEKTALQADQATESDARPLFDAFQTARIISPDLHRSVVMKGAEMGSLAGAVYEDTVKNCRELKHSLVANGTIADVAWMVTDSISYESDFAVEGQSAESTTSTSKSVAKSQTPFMTRTITIRGFDASDESVDRERILNKICTSSSVTLDGKPDVLLHSGLLETAVQIKKAVQKYIDWASPDHKIVINGHSIGGSLSVLMLLLITNEKGPSYVKSKICRVYAHGSPPVALFSPSSKNKAGDDGGNSKLNAKVGADINLNSNSNNSNNMIRIRRSSADVDEYKCDVLKNFGLPSSMVYGYVQPWDPVVRFLSSYDALYPLVDDLGSDGVTLFATGPRRSLRPITRAIIQSWEGWPVFRDNWKGTNQNYRSVGIQHLLLPEPLRYLNDRFISTNIGVPPTDSIVRISSEELLPALHATFPLDVFQISFVPQAVRSFVHHFYPAYDITIAAYATKLAKKQTAADSKQQGKSVKEEKRQNVQSY